VAQELEQFLNDSTDVLRRILYPEFIGLVSGGRLVGYSDGETFRAKPETLERYDLFVRGCSLGEGTTRRVRSLPRQEWPRPWECMIDFNNMLVRPESPEAKGFEKLQSQETLVREALERFTAQVTELVTAGLKYELPHSLPHRAHEAVILSTRMTTSRYSFVGSDSKWGLLPMLSKHVQRASSIQDRYERIDDPTEDHASLDDDLLLAATGMVDDYRRRLLHAIEEELVYVAYVDSVRRSNLPSLWHRALGQFAK
jgi:hypothetical protein